MVGHVLKALGLTRTVRLAATEEQLHKARAWSAKRVRLLEEARAESRAWKKMVKQTREALKNEKHQRAHDTQRFEKNRNGLERRAIDADTMRERLRVAEHELTVARKHLMVVEVKLDILEAAANVLDARTRAVAAQPVDAAKGAPV